MIPPASEEVKQQWKERILNQQESHISLKIWCEQNGVSPHQFYYWKNKIFPKRRLDRSAFKEIPEAKKCISSKMPTGLTLEYQGLNIHLDKQFDVPTLKQCLKALKEIS